MFRALLKWWLDGLAGPWPSPLRAWFGANKTRWWVQPADPGFRILRRKGKTWEVVATTSGAAGLEERIKKRANSNQLILLVPHENALVRSFNAPADRDPADYIESKLGEVSPLPVDQQYFDSIADANDLTLVITRKSYVDERRDELSALGMEVDEVTVAGHEHTPLNLLPHRRRSKPVDIVGVAMVAAGAALCAVGLYLSVQRQSDTVVAMALQQQRLQARLQSGQHIRDQVAQLQKGVDDIAQRKSGRPSALQLLAAVTATIPDHTWVRNWILDGNLLTLVGASADTADLISRLEASPLLKDVHFDSAITREPDRERARFRISATVGNI